MKFINYLTTLFVIAALQINAQVVINEYSASNMRMFQDNYDKYEDWIELFNTANTNMDLSGWYLSDKDSKPKKWKFPSGTVIEPNGYLLIWASGRDEVSDGHLHTNFKFTQTKNDEFVVLANPNGVIIESIALQITQLNHSICKKSSGGTLWSICTDPTPGLPNSGPKYNGYAQKPEIIQRAGSFQENIMVSIKPTTGFQTRFTTDGSAPNKTSPLWTGDRSFLKTTVLKVRNFSSDNLVLPSMIDFVTYFIKEPISTLPIFSVASEEALLLANGERELNPISSIESFDKNGNLISVSYGELDSHGQDSWVNPQRSLDWISRDEMGFNSGIAQKLFNYSERDDYQRIIFRASGDDNYPAIKDESHMGSTHVRDEYVHTLVQNGKMRMDVRAVERCILFLNGNYWGVYAIREKPDDHDYTDFNYKQDKYDLQFLKTWGNSWAEYGGEKAIRDWDTLRNMILTSDVSDPIVYKTINDNIDLTSMMDYMIANLSVVSSDWINYNTGWWRGLNPEGKRKKWNYVMWDNDATFDYYINYSGVPDTSPDAKACDIEGIADYMNEFFPPDTSLVYFPADSVFYEGQWFYFEADSFTVYPDLGQHEKIFLKLLEENEIFRDHYFGRYADMLNTAFSCDRMVTTLDSLIAIIEPEMPRHILKWGGSVSEWKSNVNRLKDFVLRRCGSIGNGLSECYDLTGSFDVTIKTNPPNSGSVRFNTLTHDVLPWSGAYYGNMKNEIEVKGNGSNQFLYWKSSNGTTILTDPNNALSQIVLNGNDELIAVFDNAVSVYDFDIQKLSLTPNPANDFIEVNLNEGFIGKSFSFKISQTDGKQVKLGHSSGVDNVMKFDVNELNNGTYILELKSDKIISNAKFIILR